MSLTPNRRRIVDIVDTEDEARRIRETFMARSAKKRQTFSWGWPADWGHIGRCLAVMYSSDKWKQVKDFEDYKHIAEAPQEFLLAPEIDLHVMGPVGRRNLDSVPIELRPPMPSDIAELAPLLGVQVQLFSKVTKGRGKLGRSKDDLFELAPARALLGGARHPSTDRAFLVIYNASRGPIALITGRDLDIEKDGVVG